MCLARDKIVQAKIAPGVPWMLTSRVGVPKGRGASRVVVPSLAAQFTQEISRVATRLVACGCPSDRQTSGTTNEVLLCCP